ncbi:CaiB/BaiF CoA transferase family protein [Oceanicola sp. S124]|uniref:CaiB/BaiF CoA transferase family protein n=1 Tax=Oceanicola sp. S124 TaxID=1042378 RepID=UPI0006837EFE|nr:CaiB/BaiF CoA-transferase family protein [Oceanicola sp. S124]
MPGFPKPLAGKRVLDLSLLYPGPATAATLRTFGAKVIKVEPPAGDPAARLFPETYRLLNRGKDIVTLDLKTDDGKAELGRLVANADVLVESFRPGVLARLGIGPEWLHAIQPRMVLVSISGYGATGPYRHQPAHDLSVLGVAGYFTLPAELEPKVVRPNIRLADALTVNAASLAAFAAIVEADRTGDGQIVDTSIFDATAAACLTMSLSRSDPDTAPEEQKQVMADSAIYACRDGKRMAVATLEDHYWAEFVRLATAEDHQLRTARYASREGRDADKTRLAELLADLFASRDREDWILIFASGRVPVVPVWEGSEALNDDHLMKRRAIARWVEGDTGFRYPSFPAIFNGARDQDASS